MATKQPTIRGALPAKFSAAEMRDYLKCRQDLHAWEDYTYTLVRNQRTRRQQIRRVVQCTRCESMRVEMMTIATGARIGNPVYHHSEGYRLAKGERFTAADRDALRIYRASKAKITVEQ